MKWEWEIPIPELGVSVFNIPRESVKGRKRDRILVRNAQSIIESVRGQHPEHVFVYSQRVKKKPKYTPIETMNNTAWQKARAKAGIPDLHVHDLRHTVGMRLREADVREETILRVLLGGPHARGAGAQDRRVQPVVRRISKNGLRFA